MCGARPMIEPPRRDPSRLRLVPKRDGSRKSARAPSAGRPRSPRVPRFVATLAGLAGIVSAFRPRLAAAGTRSRLDRDRPACRAGERDLGGSPCRTGNPHRGRRTGPPGTARVVDHARLPIVAGVSHLLKDLHVPQTGFDIGLAVVLVSYRQEFDARTGPSTIRRAVVALPVLLTVVWGFGVVAIVSHAGVIRTSRSATRRWRRFEGCSDSTCGSR
jgi:hypothetical protein